MSVVKKTRKVPYTCEQMYHLVDDVERYGEFLPYFASTEVHSRDADHVQATLNISAAGMTKSFTTRNHLQPNKMIEIRLVDGPFSQLQGFWRFDESGDGGCIVSFDLEFEFAGRMVSMLIGPVFEQITDKMVDVFCERAAILYDASNG